VTLGEAVGARPPGGLFSSRGLPAEYNTAYPNPAYWLEIPPLRAYGVEERDFPALVERAAQASSMKANPIAQRGGDDGDRFESEVTG
jgi:hypothetical protein